MAKKNPFPPEPVTQPDLSGTRASGPAPKGKRARTEAPTQPPPKARRATGTAEPPRNSGLRARKSDAGPPRAEVDEVTADLSKDPRRERD